MKTLRLLMLSSLLVVGSISAAFKPTDKPSKVVTKLGKLAYDLKIKARFHKIVSLMTKAITSKKFATQKNGAFEQKSTINNTLKHEKVVTALIAFAQSLNNIILSYEKKPLEAEDSHLKAADVFLTKLQKRVGQEHEQTLKDYITNVVKIKTLKEILGEDVTQEQ